MILLEKRPHLRLKIALAMMRLLRLDVPDQRAEVTPTVTRARTSGKPFLINFQVEKEDGVYPMIAPGAALHEMVRRPQLDPLMEDAAD